MTASNLSPGFLELAGDIYRCRVCRETWPQFANEVGDANRHPEMAHGSPSPKILIVSINPKLDEDRIPDVDLASFVARATSWASVIETNPFDQALAKALPAGCSIKQGNVTNTRVYKCPTANETKLKGVAATCASRFLAREVKILKPSVVLAMGKPAWPEVYRILAAGPAPKTGGLHATIGTLDGASVPIVACWHLSAYGGAWSDEYRFAVRRLICDALGIARDV